MHEMSLAESVLKQVEEVASREGARRVNGIYLDIGELSSVEVESLRFCFDVVLKGSVAEGAELNITLIPGLAWCIPCGENVSIRERWGTCPNCGSHQLQPTSGTEMRIREIEIV